MAKSRSDIETEITQGFVTAIKEGGTVPWRKGWTCNGILPSNFQSKRPYRGLNSVWLGLIQQAKGYRTPYWTTYNAALKSCGFPGGDRAAASEWRDANPGKGVRAGEKSSMAILWKFLPVEDKKNPGTIKKVPMLKTFPIFNLDQVDGLEAEVPERPEVDPSGIAEWIRDQYAEPPAFQQIECPQAYYSPSSDLVVVPATWQFTSQQAEAETIAHEYVHSTGHPSRLGRIDLKWQERQDYAKEELVAEIGAAMLMQQYGIEPNVPMMADYCYGWLQALQNDHSLIISAAQQAQKACDRITGYVYQEEQTDGREAEAA